MRNQTPPVDDMFEGLVQVTPRPYGNPALREALVTDGVLSTLVIPTDQPHSTDLWFDDSGGTFSSVHDDDVEFYIDGVETFRAMVEAIETTSPSLILLIGWTLFLDFIPVRTGQRRGPEVGARNGQTWEQIFRDKVTHDVQLRVVLWRPSSSGQIAVALARSVGQTAAAARQTIDGFPGAGSSPPAAFCFLDDSAGVTGSHHQKVLVIVGADGPVAFVGGIDLNPDRLDREGAGAVPPSHLHDVHCRVQGAAAQQLLRLAVERWNLATDETATRPVGGTPVGGHQGNALLVRAMRGSDIDDLSRLTSQPYVSPETGRFRLQAVQTIGNPSIAGLANHHSDYAAAVHRAIQAATGYIYVEDQYFWHVPTASALAAALANVRFLIILIPEERAAEGRLWTRWALKHLVEEATSRGQIAKLGIYQKAEYVHAKTWMFDDALAIVGSANLDARGYAGDHDNGDSESGMLVADDERAHHWYTVHANAARVLRTRLWSHHLGQGFGQLADAHGASVFWRDSSTRASNVSEYMIDGTPWSSYDFSTVRQPVGPEGSGSGYVYTGGPQEGGADAGAR